MARTDDDAAKADIIVFRRSHIRAGGQSKGGNNEGEEDQRAAAGHGANSGLLRLESRRFSGEEQLHGKVGSRSPA